MFGNHLRRKSRFALLTLGLSLLSAAGRAQTPSTYSFTFPQPGSPVSILSFDGDTSFTGGDPTFLRPRPASPLPTGYYNQYGFNNVPYKTFNVTLANAAPNYRIATTSTSTFGVSYNLYPGFYDPTMGPTPGGFNPVGSLQNVLPSYASGTGTYYNLAAGNYTLVVYGLANGYSDPFTASVAVPVTYAAPPVVSAPGSLVAPGASPYFVRPNYSATGGVPTTGTSSNNFYNVQSFTVPATGLYQVLDTPTLPLLADIFVYQNSFDPTQPIGNAIASAGTNNQGGVNLTVNLTAGTTYYLVTASNSPGVQSSVAGNFTNTVSPATLSTPTGYTGTLSASSPKSTVRPTTGVPPTSTTTITTAYDTHDYTATDNGTLKVSFSGGTVSTYAFVYDTTTTAFNPASPLQNIIGGYQTLTSGSFSFNVTAGRKYTIVASQFSASSPLGSYTVTYALTATTAPVYSYSGAISAGSGGATYAQPKAGTPPITLGSVGYYYSATTFTITTEGDYDITSTPALFNESATGSNYQATYTPFVTLYNGPFNPASPLTNAVSAAFYNATATYTGAGTTGNMLTAFRSHLTPGTYTAVTSGQFATTIGDFTLTVQQVTDTGVRFSTSGTLNPGTAAEFVPPVPNGSSVPTALETNYMTTAASGGGNDPYDVHAFTVPTSGLYNFDATSTTFPFWDDFVVLYHDSFNPASPLVNVILANDTINLSGTDAGFRNVQLNAGTTYYVVVTGGVSKGVSFPQNFGKYRGNLYQGGGQYPPIIPDNSNGGVFDPTLAAGLSATQNVADTFTVGVLNSVTINYIYHPYIGDLVATLSHGGTTIELFDRVGRTTTSGTGSTGASALLYGDYSFAAGGSDLLADVTAIGTSGGAVDNFTYAPFLNGTAGQSSTFTGDFTAFNGMPVTGAWTLNIQDLRSGNVGFYEGFTFTVTPAASTVTGTISLEGVPDLSLISPFAPLGIFDVQFRPAGSLTATYDFPNTTLTPVTGGPTGTFSIPGIAYGTYDVWIKGAKNLSVLTPGIIVNAPTVAFTSAVLPAGDSNNDNIVDSSDFGTLIGAFNSDGSVTGSGYDPTVDFNFDGLVDSTDFGLLIGEFNNSGAN